MMAIDTIVHGGNRHQFQTADSRQVLGSILADFRQLLRCGVLGWSWVVGKVGIGVCLCLVLLAEVVVEDSRGVFDG